MAAAPDQVRRLRMLIAYDGGPFMGWQSQASGKTVQDRLEAALAYLCGGGSGANRIMVHGSGRTDSGVHARGQVAHADLPAADRMTAFKWCGAINAQLPPEIRVETARFVSEKFHARFNATGKTYLYRIWNAPVLNPFEIGRAWHLSGALDVDVLKTGAAMFVGEHDFAAFAANRGKPDENTVRVIRSLRVRRQGTLLTLEFTGNGFLYKMVRLMTGSLIRCAQGRNSLEWLARLLKEGRRATKTNFVAPAEGLYLMRVRY